MRCGYTAPDAHNNFHDLQSTYSLHVVVCLGGGDPALYVTSKMKTWKPESCARATVLKIFGSGNITLIGKKEKKIYKIFFGREAIIEMKRRSKEPWYGNIGAPINATSKKQASWSAPMVPGYYMVNVEAKQAKIETRRNAHTCDVYLIYYGTPRVH